MALLSFKWLLFLLGPLFLLQGREGGNNIQSSASASLHPFYVSVTEINHNAKDRALEISCKMFVDDMEDILKQQYKLKVDLSNNQQTDQNNKLLIDYITKHLAFAVDGKPVKLNYVGYEKESESVYVYLEAANLPTIKKLDVTNSILQDFNNTQINIMHVMVNGSRKSYKLDFPNKQASFNF
jgi:hypothetical protein